MAIPARLAGVPLWTGGHGNHSWSEVWDGSWHVIASSESKQIDHAWFLAKAAQADPADPLNRIYATSFARTGTRFPLIWDLPDQTVPALDVTALYRSRGNVTVRVVDAAGKPATAAVTLRFDGHIVAAAHGKSSYDFMLAGGQTYEADLVAAGGKTRTEKLSIPKEAKGPVELRVP